MQRVRVLVLAVLVLVASGAAREILVTSTADAGTGTLRWALQTARPGDVVLFNPSVFPPGSPAVIHLMTGLPCIWQGRVTVDASNAGVILDGSRARGEWVTGIDICSNDNTIMGLQIVNFSGAGIHVNNAHRNTIGGDRTKGTGPLGQGNLTSRNADGIGLRGARDNVIVGNLIGTDVTQSRPMGNRVVGIFIQDGASRNVIGPSNVIAFNHHHGVDIRDPACVNNTITANSIHSNDGLALSVPHPVGLASPLILDFDLHSGAVSGGACAGCRVEVFSDEGHQGAIYEGEAHANDEGRFAFPAGRSLAGPNLTATATDYLGSTSAFSSPTQGTGVGRILQACNGSTKSAIVTYPSNMLADNRIGGLWNGFWHPFDMVRTVKEQIIALGLKRARLTINQLEPVTSSDTGGTYVEDLSKPEMAVDPSHDLLFTMAADAGVEITYTLVFWDKDGPFTEQVMSGPRFNTEDQIARYLDFARFMVRHFRDRVVRFEVWNEPDLDGVPGQYIHVEDYIRLVHRLVPVIRAEFPEAKIQVGGVAGLRDHFSATNRQRPYNYLLRILQSDIMPLVDVVSWHPLFGESPENEADYYYAYPSMVRELKAVAGASGFRGEYEADELTWWTHGQLVDQPWRYTYIEAAKYYARGIAMHLGMDVTAGLGGISQRPHVFATQQHLCTIMAGHEAIDMPVEIHIDYDGPMAYCSFRYLNGDRILALWTDGVAQEEDPGVPAVIKFPGITAGRVTGIDVLHGFEQELIFDSQGGSTKVSDVLVKDYPILIRLSGLTFSPDYVETVGDGFHQMGDSAVASGRGEERHAIGEPIVLSLEASATITLLWLRDDGSRSTVRFHSTRYVAESGRHEASIPTTGLMPGLYELWIKDKVRVIRLVNR